MIAPSLYGAGRSGYCTAGQGRYMLHRRSRGDLSSPARGDQLIRDPVLIVEVLSPGTGLFDRQTKVADYRRIPSVEEIVLIDSTSIFAEVLRREGDRWITEIVRGLPATLSLSSIGLSAAMSDLYEGIELPDSAAPKA